MDERNCIVHYEIRDAKYSNLKEISSTNKERIYAAKSLRETLGGPNQHADQCQLVPKEIDPVRHGVHLVPCYKKFTLILAKERNLSSDKFDGESSSFASRPKRAKTADHGSSSNVYPKECNFCSKYRIMKKNKIHFPITVCTVKAVQTIKEAAESKEDQSLFFEIKDADLIAREFKYHESCYKEYTRKNKSSVKPVENERSVGDFDRVKECVEEKILSQNQAISMHILHDQFGAHTKDTRYRSKLKAKIQATFPGKLHFLTVDANTPEVVISADAIISHTLVKDREHLLRQAAECLREDILEHAQSISDLAWPPRIEELSCDARKPPETLEFFLSHLLKNKDHPNRDNANRLVRSYSSDLIHGVTRGKTITAKHFLLGLGLHNLTGQKVPIQVLNHLGHCIDYNLVCEIETAQAEAAQQIASSSGALPIKPVSSTQSVLTYFWVDNFDMNLETQTGHGAVNSTHMVAFQEESPLAINRSIQVNIPRSKRRSLEILETEPPEVIVDSKREPLLTMFSVESTVTEIFQESPYLANYLLWIIMRKLNSTDQTVSTYSGWRTHAKKINSSSSLKKTVLTYLPPINAKVTEFATIYRYLKYLQRLAAEVNMPYVNVTLDVGAAMNAERMLWNYPTTFKNVLIHLGDFHFMKENFGVIGKIIKGSGFEDVIFQAGVCSSGSLNGVLAGSHYNRAWTVHRAFSEALERLLLERFLLESNTSIPESFVTAARVPDSFYKDVLSNNATFVAQYQDFKESIRNGKLGKTPRFWLLLYLDLMQTQHLIHLAVQDNDFEMRIQCWKFFLPLYFALQKMNYARYGSYYVKVMENIEKMYPGLKDLLMQNGMSVQAQESFPIRVAIDQRGEQTINRDAKTSGGIKSFAADSSAILKWTLNRSEQAENTKALLSLADVNHSASTYKPLRPSQILQSEKFVTRIIDVLKEEYVNPFGVNVDKEKLVNLSSGIALDDRIAAEILSTRSVGEKESQKFREERLESSQVKFHDPIKRRKLALFSSSSKKVTIEENKKVKAIEVNRNILGTLLSISAKSGQAIDFEKALEYPLCPVPLSLANADGSRRVTSKSALIQVILKKVKRPVLHPRESQPPKEIVSAFIVDMMASLRGITQIPETYEDLTWKFLKQLPSGYSRVDIVADTYQEVSLKSAERNARGISSKVIISSNKSKIPRNFSDFMKNDDNKRRLICLMRDTIIANKAKALNLLRCQEIYFSTDNDCRKVTHASCEIEDQLVSNQEEADTKLILHCCHALNTHPPKKVIIRSPSGDTDILVIMLNKLLDEQDRIYLDYGNGMHRKGLWLSDIDMSDPMKKCMLGFHAFTGNDYISSFFRRGKAACWKVVKKNPKFIDTFTGLGLSWDLHGELADALEEFVCLLYGSRKKKVNSVRSEMFERKHINQKKVIDISQLPPCQSTLLLHSKRANVVAKIWNSSHEPMLEVPEFSLHGWNEELEIHWMDLAFPRDINSILFDPSFETDEEFNGIDEESDDEQ